MREKRERFFKKTATIIVLLSIVCGCLVIFGWLKLSVEPQGLVPNKLGLTLVAIGNILLVSLMLWISARTKQKQTEHQDQSCRQWAETFNALSDGISIHNLDHTIIDANSALEKLLGTSRTQLIDQKCFNIFHCTDRPIAECPLERVLQSKKTESAERFEPALNRWLAISASPLFDNQGNLRQIIHVVRDITERKQSEEGLKRHAKQMQALLDLAKLRDRPIKEIATFALETCVAMTDSQVGFFHFYDETTGTITLNTWSQNVYADCSVNQDQHYPLEKAGVWADCVRLRQPVIFNDYPKLPTKRGYPQGHFPVARFASLPIFDLNKIVMICGVGNKAQPYNQEDIEDLQVFLNNVWSIFKEFLAEVQIKDQLTNLQRVNKIMVDRELRMIELKEELKKLKNESSY